MMPTPEHLRWVSSELGIELLTHFTLPDQRGVIEKQVARWFPDADLAERKAIAQLVAEHFETYAMLLRSRSDGMLATGRMVAGRYPQ